LSEEQRLMRESCRAFVDDLVTPFIGDLPAHGRHRGHLAAESREGAVPGDRGRLRRAGKVTAAAASVEGHHQGHRPQRSQRNAASR
jgi:hypothetical protein